MKFASDLDKVAKELLGQLRK